MSTDIQKTFTLSRKEAAQILKVSTRTLDRYIIKNTLSSKNVAGRIFLSEEDLLAFLKAKKRKKRRKPAARKLTKSQSNIKSKSNIVAHERDDNVYDLDISGESKSGQHSTINITEEPAIDIPVEVYDLPVEVATEPEFNVEVQTESDFAPASAHESESVDTVPMSDYFDAAKQTEDLIYKKLYEEQKEEVRSFQRRLEGANYRVGQLESQVKESVPLLEHQKLLTGHKKEVFNKKILYVLLGALLLAQPLWIFLAFN